MRRVARRRYRRWRLASAAIVALLAVTIGYGERWLLRDAPAVTIEFAAGDGFARALDQGFGAVDAAYLHRFSNGSPRS